MRRKFGSSRPGRGHQQAARRQLGTRAAERSSTTGTSSHPLRRVAFGRVDASRAASGNPGARAGTGAKSTAPGQPAPEVEPVPQLAVPGAARLRPVAALRHGFRRLLGVRFAIQLADGMFQAALGGAVLFNPERQADPLAVAAGLAVLLLPYSLIGPFAGALLDRWDRRRVLMFASLLRAAAGRRGGRHGRPPARAVRRSTWARCWSPG